MPVFALLVRYTRPAAEVEPHLEAHRRWIDRLDEDGRRVLVAARQVPPAGGLILAAAGSLAEVAALVAEDPFVTQGVARYEVMQVEVRRTAPGLQGLLDM